MTVELASCAKFQIGEAVQVLHLGKIGHVRIPHYVRGNVGCIIQHCGVYLNPEELAVGITSGRVIHLYRVVFQQCALWPQDNHSDGDQLVIEIYEHWLAAAGQSSHTLSRTTD